MPTRTRGLARTTRLEASPWKPGAHSTIRPVSRRQAKRERALAKAKRRLIEERGDVCEAAPLLDAWLAQWPETSGGDVAVLAARVACSGGADELHHRLPRAQGGRDEDANSLLACHSCHRWITDNPMWARLVGLVESRKTEGSHVA